MCLLTEKAAAAKILPKAKEVITCLLAEKAVADKILSQAKESNMCLLAEKAAAVENLTKTKEANMCFLAKKAVAAENRAPANGCARACFFQAARAKGTRRLERSEQLKMQKARAHGSLPVTAALLPLLCPSGPR